MHSALYWLGVILVTYALLLLAVRGWLALTK